jgi:hypothetical protein
MLHRSIPRFVTAIVVAGSLSSCATVLAPKYSSVTISVQPDSSRIYTNGQFMGYSPLHIEIESAVPQLLEVKHDGYEPQRMVLKTGITPLWITADILLTAGIGALIDYTTGKWNQFTPSVIIMDLSKLPE